MPAAAPPGTDATARYPAWLADRGARRALAVAIGAGTPILLLIGLALGEWLAGNWRPSARPALGPPTPVEFLAPGLRGFAPEGHGVRSIAHLAHRSAGTTLSGSEVAFSVLLTETEAGARVEFDGAYGVESTGLGSGELGTATISGDAESVRVRVPYELRTGYSVEAGTVVVAFRVVADGEGLSVTEDGVERARYPRLR